jgi:hypothetical protein
VFHGKAGSGGGPMSLMLCCRTPYALFLVRKVRRFRNDTRLATD